MGPLAGVVAGTLVLAVVLERPGQRRLRGPLRGGVLPLFLLVVATGVAVLPGRRFRVGCVAVLALAGLFDRARARTVSSEPRPPRWPRCSTCRPSPATWWSTAPTSSALPSTGSSRLPGVTEITFPRAIGPQRVDWVDYKKVIAATDVDTFAQTALAQLADRSHPVAGLEGRLPGSGRRLRLPEELAGPAAAARAPPLVRQNGGLLRVREPGPLLVVTTSGRPRHGPRLARTGPGRARMAGGTAGPGVRPGPALGRRPRA